jgi:hypothetical protein
MRQHPQVPERWGLHNASDFAWPVSYPGGQDLMLDPDRTIELIPGARIQIGNATVQVRRPVSGDTPAHA